MSRQRSNMCDGKVRHPSHPEAMRAMRRTNGINLMVYACKCCDGFHVGNRRNLHSARGTYCGGSRYQRVLDAIEAAVRS